MASILPTVAAAFSGDKVSANNSNLRSLLPSGTTVELVSPAGVSNKKSILKENNENPWTATVLPASVHLVFPEPVVNATHIALTFQGGFVGTTGMVYCAFQPSDAQNDINLGLMMGGNIYPEDKNKRQIFEIPYPPDTHVPSKATQAAIDSQPIHTTSLNRSGHPANIVTEVLPNPSGDGAPAPPIVNKDPVDITGGAAWLPPALKELKIEFNASSDHHGRITLYQIEILG